MGSMWPLASGASTSPEARAFGGLAAFAASFRLGSDLLRELTTAHEASIIIGRIGFVAVHEEHGREVTTVCRLAEDEVFAPPFIAPELQAGGSVSVQSDLYAVGVYLRSQFEAARTATLAAGPGPVFTELPVSIGSFLRQATAASPDARFRSAREMLLELHAARCLASSVASRSSSYAAAQVTSRMVEPAQALGPGVRRVSSYRIGSSRPSFASEAIQSVRPPRARGAGRVVAGFLLAAGLAGFFVWQSEGVRLERELRQVVQARSADQGAAPDALSLPGIAADGTQQASHAGESLVAAPGALPLGSATASVGSSAPGDSGAPDTPDETTALAEMTGDPVGAGDPPAEALDEALAPAAQAEDASVERPRTVRSARRRSRSHPHRAGDERGSRGRKATGPEQAGSLLRAAAGEAPPDSGVAPGQGTGIAASGAHSSASERDGSGALGAALPEQGSSRPQARTGDGSQALPFNPY